jgi:hypothetical protein
MLFSRVSLLLVSTALLAVAFSAGAGEARKTYKCLNGKGEIYYSDHYDPERCKGGGAQLNSEGIQVRKIDRQMTPEEVAEAKEKAAREAEEQRVAEKQAHADRVLLQTFANEDELTRAHQKELAQVDTEMTAGRAALKAQEKNLTELLNMAADAERAGQKVPAGVTKNIGIVRRQVDSQKTFILRKQTQKDDLDRSYQAQLARYRELVSQKATGK